VTIKWEGGQDFIIKTKQMTANIGEKILLGELTISKPGEYEVGGVQIEVIDGIIQVYAEGMSIAHMRKGKVLSDTELENLNGIDILLMGVGGGEFTETKTALTVISQIEPAIVIPMHKGNIEEFAKEEGLSTEGIDELKLSRGDLPTDENKVVVLNARR
jgi:hypothetical protein